MLGKLKIFLRSFHGSVTTLSYYEDVTRANLIFSVKYYVLYSLFLGLILSLVTALLILPTLTTVVSRFKSKAPGLFPSDLIITLKDGKIATNVTEPLRFPIPFELFVSPQPAIPDQKQVYLITIDTASTPDAYPETQSVLFFTRDYLVMPDEHNQYRTYPLKEFGDVTLDKQAFDSLVQKILPFTDIIGPVAIIAISCIFMLAWPIYRILGILGLSVVVYGASRIMHLPYTYRTVFQIGLHSSTLPFLIQIGAVGLGIFPLFPFFTSIVYLLYNLLILAHLRSCFERL